MAKLKSEFLSHYYAGRRRPLRDYVFGYFHVTARLLSALAPIVNAAARFPPARGIVARGLQITASRSLPRFRMRPPRTRPRTGGVSVLFLRDPFNHCVDTDVEQAAFDLLGAAGFNVRALDALGAGASLISKGFLAGARSHARAVVHELDQLDSTGACPVLAIEPSELSALRHDYADLLPDMPARTRDRLNKAMSVEEFLAQSGRIDRLRIAITGQQVAIHPHCHQKAETGSVSEELGLRDASMELLQGCGYDVRLIEAGCCGMAGTFGYEAEHYELSQRIGEMQLFPQIRELPGTLIAATGAACRMQISQGTGAVVQHPLVLAAKTIAL